MGMAKRALWTLLAFLPALGPVFPVFAAVRAATPAATVRVAPAGPSSLAGFAPTLTLTPASALPAASLAPSLPRLIPAPSLAPAPGAVAPAAAAPLAAAAAPRLPLAASPAGERTGEIVAALSAESVARAPAETSSSLAGELFAEGSAHKGPSGDVLGAPSLPSALAPASLSGPAAAAAPRAPSLPSRRADLRDHAHHWRLLGQSFWWYMTTNVRNKWRGQREAWNKAAAAGPVAVSRQREFFAAMRTTGMSGHFYVLGGAALPDAEVMADMRAAFRRYFDHPAIPPAANASFERFMARAMSYNTERRSHTYFYKTIRDAMIKASLLRPEQLSGHFDGLLQEGMAQETLDFQNKGEQKRVREAFRSALLQVLDEEDPLGKDRVVAALVLGSFASGAAGPLSDFDVEVITANGSDARVKPFSDRILAVWKEAGLHGRHPVTVHEHAARPTRAYLDLVHSADYFIVARNAALEGELSRAPGEKPAFTVNRNRGVRGRLGVMLQGLFVRGTILTEELKALLPRR